MYLPLTAVVRSSGDVTEHTCFFSQHFCCSDCPPRNLHITLHALCPLWLLLAETWSCRGISGEPCVMLFPIACFFQNTLDKRRHKPWSMFYEGTDESGTNQGGLEDSRRKSYDNTEVAQMQNPNTEWESGSFNKLSAEPQMSATICHRQTTNLLQS